MDAELKIEGQRAALERWLFDSALPLWWAQGADHRAGGFHDALSSDAQPIEAPRRLRVQARQVYVYATAGRLGWRGPSATATEHGLEAIFRRHRRPDGLYRASMGAQGRPADDTALLYDQAFVLLALASAKRVLPERREDLRRSGLELLQAITEAFGYSPGAYMIATDGRPFQSNPHMHLFEAMLTWSQEDPDGPWGGVADAIAELCLERFIDRDSGVLREFFALDWSPAAGVDGRIAEPGHQFEWAWLLEQWGQLRERTEARSAARKLFQIGMAGIDPHRGVAQDALLDDLTTHQARARLWPQTEWIKASCILAEGELDGDLRLQYLDGACSALIALRRYLDTPAPGLWRDKLDPANQFVLEASPATSLYHIVGAIAELKGARIIARRH